MIPVRGFINWTFTRNADFNWKASLIVGCSIAMLWYFGVCISTFIDVRRVMLRERSFRQSYPATALIAGIYAVGVIMASALVVGMYREGDPLWMQTIPLGLFLISFYGWPRTIHCDSNGIWQRTRFGIKKYIPYSDVLAVGRSGEAAIVTGAKASIEHTEYHAGAEQFQELLQKRTGKEIY